MTLNIDREGRENEIESSNDKYKVSSVTFLHLCLFACDSICFCGYFVNEKDRRTT